VEGRKRYRDLKSAKIKIKPGGGGGEKREEKSGGWGGGPFFRADENAEFLRAGT